MSNNGVGERGTAKKQVITTSSIGERTRSNTASTGKAIRRKPVPAWEEEQPGTGEGGGDNGPSAYRTAGGTDGTKDKGKGGKEGQESSALSHVLTRNLVDSPRHSPTLSLPGSSKSRRPPVADLNKAPLPELDQEGHSVSNILPSSRGSTRPERRVSATTDGVLTQLGEAVRRERKKAELYEGEVQQGRLELADIACNLDILRDKFATILEQQEQMIASLENQVADVKAELEVVNQLDPAAASGYLTLIHSPLPSHLKARTAVVCAFDPTALTSTPSPPITPILPDEPVPTKLRSFPLRRLSFKRRDKPQVDDSDSAASCSHIAVPDTPPATPLLVASPTSTSTPFLLPRRPSNSSSVGPPMLATVHSPAATSQPRPGPIMRSLSSENPHLLYVQPLPSATKKSKRRPPPVSGISRGRSGGGLSRAVGDTDSGDRTERVARGPSLTRKRSNSLTRALSNLFPSAGTKREIQQDRQSETLDNPVEAWLRSSASSPAL
ncbi:hypothetical protein JCM11641_007031 [Rhodosporidiobolus odoratus]